MLYHAPEWCRPHGIPVDRSTLVPDDAITDAQAAVAAAFEHAYLDLADAAPHSVTAPRERRAHWRSGEARLSDRRFPPPGRAQG